MSRHSVFIAKAAENDISDAIEWYEERSTKTSVRFQKHLQTTIKFLAKHPQNFQLRYNDIRVAFLAKFPFGIHFKLKNKSVLIVAVFHTSLNPAKWDKRDKNQGFAEL